jgi:tetratricopeptide (TPR) repeat protein
MRETLLQAVDAAQASGHDAALARAFTYLVLVSHLSGDPGQAHLWARLSGSTLERLGGHDEIAADRENFLGMVANQEQRPLAAVTHFRRHLALLEREGSRRPRHPAYQNIGVSLLKAGRYRQAEAYFERGLRELERTFGPDHPDVAGSLFGLGRLHHEQGDTAAAIDFFRRSLALYDRHRWPGRYSAFPLTGLGQALTDAGRAAEAVPLLERAVGVRAGGAEDPAGLALSRFHLARALWLAGEGGQRARARPLALAARDGFRDLGDRARGDVAQVEAWLAAHPGTP